MFLGIGHTVAPSPLPVHLLSASIFVDGTKPIVGAEDGEPFLRMADSFQGRYVGDGTVPVFVDYPRSLGLATGLADPTYDESEADAAAKIVRAVRQARADDPTGAIYVVGYSQGAGTVSSALAELESDPDFSTDNIEFVLASSPRRNSGGILTRLPPGVYVPMVGVTFGEGATPERTKVLQISKMYDGISDSPDFVLNLAADANAALGFVFLHSGYYREVDPDDPTAIVTTSADGLVTDKLIPAPVGQLPLTMPLLQLGVSPQTVTALDPFLRAIIETGYQRPDSTVPGSFPSEPVPFRLVPPPTRWVSDAEAVAQGAVQSARLFGDIPQAGPSSSRAFELPTTNHVALQNDQDDVEDAALHDAVSPGGSRNARIRLAESGAVEPRVKPLQPVRRVAEALRPRELLRSAWAQRPPTASDQPTNGRSTGAQSTSNGTDSGDHE
ncbi:PE-PPE domain-containing protein [Mycolicibacterium psychrotolerans]|uniref:PE-PPE domain-containing protein n=1 Tax=Mycolicibacterium psychrotolerans TaxID=216929 RepID=UPI0013D45FDA|nr:PE-PPE domain-containing protein [Mycolicibacterium psychrotolerans]